MPDFLLNMQDFLLNVPDVLLNKIGIKEQPFNNKVDALARSFPILNPFFNLAAFLN